jgi:hypothetical protein
MNKLWKIVLYVLIVCAMIALITIIKNDYLLAGIYLLIVIVTLILGYEKGDLTVLIFGLIAMTFFEFIFISTGIETFIRNSLFGMPLWLPLLWAYGFLLIKRSIILLKW